MPSSVSRPFHINPKPYSFPETGFEFNPVRAALTWIWVYQIVTRNQWELATCSRRKEVSIWKESVRNQLRNGAKWFLAIIQVLISIRTIAFRWKYEWIFWSYMFELWNCVNHSMFGRPRFIAVITVLETKKGISPPIESSHCFKKTY